VTEREPDVLARGIRVRISHTRTARSGWHHESTVELVDDIPVTKDEDDLFRRKLRYLLHVTDDEGRAENQRRNDLDRQGRSP